MLIESKRYQAEELPQIYASRVTIAKLQKSMRKEEQRKKNLPELGRRRWNSGGEHAEEGPISQQCRGGKRRRWRRRRQRCRASSSVGAGVEQVGGGAGSLFHGPAVKRKRQRDRGRR
jgi:hypothetical protein